MNIAIDVPKDKESEKANITLTENKYITLNDDLKYNLANLCATAERAAMLIDEGYINRDEGYMKDFSQLDLFSQLNVEELLNDLYYCSSIVQYYIPEIISLCGHTEEGVERLLEICENEYDRIEEQLENIDCD